MTPELPVADVRATQAYYRDALGFRIAWLYEESYGAVYNGKLANGSPWQLYIKGNNLTDRLGSAPARVARA